MTSLLKHIRVFIASASDLGAERQAFREVLAEYNTAEAIPRGVLFEAIGWEDVLGQQGRPQAAINVDLERCDYCVIAIGDKWGSATGKDGYRSGVHEEFDVASRSVVDPTKPMKDVVVLFREPQRSLAGFRVRQSEEVTEFRKRLEDDKSHLFKIFRTADDFRKQLRQHFASWLRDVGGVGLDGIDPRIQSVASRGPWGKPDTHRIPIIVPFQSERSKRALQLFLEGRGTEAEIELETVISSDGDPEALIAYATLLNSLGRLDRAKVLSERALKHSDLKQTTLAEGLSLLGYIELQLGELNSAKVNLEKAIEVARSTADKTGLASAYGNLGTVRFHRGELQAAEEAYRQALDLDLASKDEAGMARSYGNLGAVYSQLGRIDQSVAMTQKGLAIDTKLGRKEGIATAWTNIGIGQLQSDDYDAAESSFLNALRVAEGQRPSNSLATALINLAAVHYQKKNIDRARDYATRAVEVADRLQDQHLKAQIYENASRSDRTNSAGTFKLADKALAVYAQLGEDTAVGRTALYLSACHLEFHDYQNAEALATQAINAYRKSGAKPSIAQALSVRAAAYVSLKDSDRGRADLLSAIEIQRELGDLAAVAADLLSLAKLEFSFYKMKEAEAAATKAVEAAKDVDESILMRAHYLFADVLKKTGRLSEAETSLSCALDSARKLKNEEWIENILSDSAVVQMHQGRLERAEAILTEALEIAVKPGLRRNLARCYDRLGSAKLQAGALDAAEDWYRKSLSIREELDDQSLLPIGLGNLGNSLRLKGDLQGAMQMYERALAIAEKNDLWIDVALSHSNLSGVRFEMGDDSGGMEAFKKSREVARRIGMSFGSYVRKPTR